MNCDALSMIVLSLIIVVIFLKLDVRRLERIERSNAALDDGEKK